MLFFFVATAAFSIQIYADFSGCMDIATGTARLFGIRLAPNFLRPYFSKIDAGVLETLAGDAWKLV